MTDDDIVLTEHAQKRVKDRGIPEVARWILREFGTCRRAGRGVESYSFDKKSWKEVERFFGHWPLKKMDQLHRTYMVVTDNGAMITMGFRDE